MKLARIIDLEAQLARDLAAEDDGAAWEAVLDRDREIAAQLRAEGHGEKNAPALFDAWLDQVGTKSLPGRHAASGLSGLRLLLVIAGLLLGSGLVLGLKQAVVDGPLPYINLPLFWMSLVGIQLVLLIFLCLSGLLSLLGLPGIARHLALVQGMTIGACRRVMNRVIRTYFPEQDRRLREGLARMSGKRLYYGRIAQWLAMETSQRFAVAFNLAALLTLLFIGNVEQLNFGWSTTRSENGWFPPAVQALAAPWRAFMPAAAPDPEAIAATRMISFPVEPPGPVHMETWWRFMLMNLLVYGLLLRLGLWVFSAWRYRGALLRIPLDHEDFLRLRNRLTRTWFVEPATRAAATSPVVVWGALPEDLREPVDARMAAVHGGSASFHQAGHHADPQFDEALCRELGARGPSRVVVMIPVWNEPIDELESFLARLRGALGAEAEILVDLVDVAEGGLHAVETRKKMVWESFLNRVRDPRLTAMASEEERP